jgi:hypothetical protein
MPYRTLNADNIEATIERLHKRIMERFPDRGIVRLCAELLTIAREDRERLSWVVRPNLLVRTGVGVAIVLGAGGVIWTLLNLGPMRVSTDAVDLVQGVEAILNIVALAGAAIWFLLNLESNMRRDRVLADLHELRSIAHVVDMHQLTKDPTVILNAGPKTASSPERDMTRFELARYLEYCAEMLALTGKLAAVMAGESDDHVIIAGASDVENLCTDLGRKVWQKIMILGELDERG